MPRFQAHRSRPEHLVASVVALAEQTNRLALRAAMEAARADSLGKAPLVVEQACRLAVGAGVATGEIAWLVGELEASEPSARQLAEAAVAVAGIHTCMEAVSQAVQEVADRRAPTEVVASAEALRRISRQLEDLEHRIQPRV